MITISIEDASVKITSLKGKRVVFAVEAPLQAGWVRNGIVFEKGHVSQVISMVLAQNKINEKEVVAAVSGIQSIYRVVYVPKLDRALLAEAARKEMARAIPVPLASLYTSWTDVKTSDIEVALCLVGIPFDNVNSVTDTLKLCGLQLKYLELRPLAVCRVIDEKTAIVVNVQPGCFDMIVISNGIPEMMRSLPFPGGASMSDGDKARMVKEEVDRTVNFYNSGHPSSPLGQQAYCVVSGILRETLSMVMGYPVKPAPALLAYPQEHDANDFIVNSGLALRTISQLTKVDINVIPGTVPVARPVSAGINLAPLIALGVCAALALGMWLLSGTATKQTADMQLLMNEKNTQLSSLQKQYRDVTEQAAKATDTYRQELNLLNAPIKYLADQRGSLNRGLGQVFASLPANMFLTDINDEGSKIVVEGSAPSEEILLNYSRNLRNSGLYSLVMISSVSSSTYTEVKFTMELTVIQ